jgi:hypothetical protein
MTSYINFSRPGRVSSVTSRLGTGKRLTLFYSVGLATEFHSGKIPRDSLGTFSVIPQKKVLILRHSKVNRRVNSEALNGTELNGKISFTKNPAPAYRTESVLSSAKCFGTEFREFDSLFAPRNGIPSCFLFRGMVQNRIPRVASTVQNSKHFSPLRT